MKTKILSTIILFLFVNSTFSQEANCLLTVDLRNNDKSASIYLSDAETGRIVDSSNHSSGKFIFKLIIPHPKQFILHNARNKYEFRDRKIIWLEPGEMILEGDFNFIGNSIFKGSKSYEEYNEYKKFYESQAKTRYDIQYLSRYNNGRKSFESAIPELSFDQKCNELLNSTGDFIKKNNESYVSLLALYELNMVIGRYKQAEIKQLLAGLSDELRDTKKGEVIRRISDLPYIPQIGDPFVDIIQPNPKGDTIKLSDFIGNYILIDFWASWCAPCRRSNPHLRELNEKYKDEDFVIFSVSGDNNKKRWIQAIENDSLDWPNVSDLGGWNNRAFDLYEVHSIPYEIIIDKNGIIIGKDYCDPELTQALKELFNY